MINLSRRGGVSILGLIILAILVVMILNYFNISVKVSVEDGGRGASGQDLWHDYIKKPLDSLWKFIREVFWEPFLSNLKRMGSGEPTDFNTSAPAVPY